MKKSLVALAALAVVGAASAQSTVTLYGAIDASYNYMSSGDVSVSKLANSQLGSSKLGFKGEEDLGGGLKAVFKLEGGLANDSGNGKASNTNNQATGGCTVANVTLLDPTKQDTNLKAGTTACAPNGSQGLDFQRFSYVGLAGSFGEIHLGREYVMSFLHGQGVVDVFGTNGPADATNMFFKAATSNASAVVTNISNMVTYESPSMGGFKVGAQLYMGENNQGSVGATDNGSGYSGYVEYANGPIFGSLATSSTKYAQTATEGDYEVTALGASYDFGAAKLVYTYATEKTNALTAPKNTTNLIGVAVPMGAATFKASYIAATYNSGAAAAADKTGTLLGLGVDYALSKRTTAYASYANVTNSDNSALYSTGVNNGVNGNSSSNLAIGVYHKF